MGLLSLALVYAFLTAPVEVSYTFHVAVTKQVWKFIDTRRTQVHRLVSKICHSWLATDIFSDFMSYSCSDYMIYWKYDCRNDTLLKSQFFVDSDTRYEGDFVRYIRNYWRLYHLAVNFYRGKFVLLIKPEILCELNCQCSCHCTSTYHLNSTW